MTHKEIISFRKEFEGVQFENYSEMIYNIEKALLSFGLCLCDNYDDAVMKFRSFGDDREVEVRYVTEVYVFVGSTGYQVKIREYYVDPGSVDYLYSYDIVPD